MAPGILSLDNHLRRLHVVDFQNETVYSCTVCIAGLNPSNSLVVQKSLISKTVEYSFYVEVE